MPRQKRLLAQADANASKPAAKRVSTGPSAAAGDENAETSNDGYDQMNAVHLMSILKERGIPFSDERTSAMIQRLREVDRTSVGRYDSMEKKDLAAILGSRGLNRPAL